MVGSNLGVSMKTQVFSQNLCKEITETANRVLLSMGAYYTPYIPSMLKEPKYKFSRKHWYIAHYGQHDVIEVFDWCEQQFGQCPQNRDAWTRWHSGRPWVTIWFRDQKDYNWFQLRWAS